MFSPQSGSYLIRAGTTMQAAGGGKPREGSAVRTSAGSPSLSRRGFFLCIIGRPSRKKATSGVACPRSRSSKQRKSERAD